MATAIRGIDHILQERAHILKLLSQRNSTLTPPGNAFRYSAWSRSVVDSAGDKLSSVGRASLDVGRNVDFTAWYIRRENDSDLYK